MEEQKAILKFFRTLSEEQNEDTELSFNLKNNGDMSFEEALENSRDSLLYVILPREGEKVTFNSNDSDMTEEERNIVNLREQQSEVVNTENDSEKQTIATNQEQNKMSDAVNGWSNESCHITPEECALRESPQAKCQHVSTEYTNTDCDCVGVNQDNAKGADQGVRNHCEKVHCQEDFEAGTVSFDPEESEKSEHVVMAMTRTGPSVEEQVEPVTPMFEPKNDNEEKGTGDEEEEEKRDVFPDFSTQPHHPPSPEDTSPHVSITSATVANNPPPGSTFTRATFSPGSPTDKQIQLPALFSSMRILRKGVVGPEHDTVAQIKPSSQGARRDIFSDKQGDAKVQGNFLDQISQFLNREKRGDEKEEKKEVEAEGDRDDAREKSEETEEGERKETEEDAEASLESTKPSVTSAEAAFDAFKAFFTPKPLKKDPAEKVDLEAVRKKIRADKDVLRSIFERASNKTPEKKDSPDNKV